MILIRMVKGLAKKLSKMWSESESLKKNQPAELKRNGTSSLNNWKELIKFLDDPHIPLTNNEAERTIRQGSTISMIA